MATRKFQFESALAEIYFWMSLWDIRRVLNTVEKLVCLLLSLFWWVGCIRSITAQ